ncbi:hypothetical protein F4X33_20730 [Candidatus Poribacteria bacterium]|nr:hypothetical protein [Candidatus Poribacteria bacterium]
MKFVVGFVFGLVVGFILGKFLHLFIVNNMETVKEFGEVVDNFFYAIAAFLVAIAQLIKSLSDDGEPKNKQERRLQQTTREEE